jgi:hypothetical protein
MITENELENRGRRGDVDLDEKMQCVHTKCKAPGVVLKHLIHYESHIHDAHKELRSYRRGQKAIRRR